MPSAQVLPSAVPAELRGNTNTENGLKAALDKIDAFNAIKLPEKYPKTRFIIKLDKNELTAVDFYLLAGQVDEVKKEDDKIVGITPLQTKLRGLLCAALNGKIKATSQINALTEAATVFKIDMNAEIHAKKISLEILFTILHYAALGGEPLAIDQAIRWIHEYHRNRNRFSAIAKLLPTRSIITAAAWAFIVGLIFAAIHAFAMVDTVGMGISVGIGTLILSMAIIITIACWHTPVQLLRKYPGFDTASRQSLDASGPIALIAAIQSNNPEAIQLISKFIRSSTITYPIPTETITTYSDEGVFVSKKTKETFTPNYSEYVADKTSQTQTYTASISQYHSSCCYRTHPQPKIQPQSQSGPQSETEPQTNTKQTHWNLFKKPQLKQRTLHRHPVTALADTPAGTGTTPAATSSAATSAASPDTAAVGTAEARPTRRLSFKG